MSMTGPLSHIDLSVSQPDVSIPFYAAFFDALGFARFPGQHADFQGESPRRAAWFIEYPSGGFFGIEVRPSEGANKDRSHDRYSPGLHHLAFHAPNRSAVDGAHLRVVAEGGRVLDPPYDYSGEPGYSEGYYAAFFADPDGLKLEVVFDPGTNP